MQDVFWGAVGKCENFLELEKTMDTHEGRGWRCLAMLYQLGNSNKWNENQSVNLLYKLIDWFLCDVYHWSFPNGVLERVFLHVCFFVDLKASVERFTGAIQFPVSSNCFNALSTNSFKVDIFKVFEVLKELVFGF